MQQVAKNGTMMQKLVYYMQLAFQMANVVNPQMAVSIGQDLMATTGMAMPMPNARPAQMPESDNIAGIEQKEPTIVQNARQQAASASKPDESAVVREDRRK